MNEFWHSTRVGLPFLALFGIALPMLAPLIDVLAVYRLFFFDRSETAIGWLAMLGLQLITAIVAFRLDKEKLRVLWALPLQAAPASWRAPPTPRYPQSRPRSTTAGWSGRSRAAVSSRWWSTPPTADPIQLATIQAAKLPEGALA